MRLAYANEDEFVKTYCYYCEQEAVFAPTDKIIPANSECAFSLELTDGSPMLRGLGVVLDCWTTDDNRFGRRGVYIGFSQLTTTSEAIHARMLALRKAEEEESTEVTQIPVAPRTRNIRSTQQQWGGKASDIAMPEVEETDVGDLQKSITQEMRAASESGLLAVAVPQVIEEKTQNTQRYEGPIRGPALPAKRAQSPIPLAALAAAAAPPPAVSAAPRPAAAATPPPRSPTPPPTPTVRPPLPQPTPLVRPPPVVPAAASTSAAVETQERPSAPALPPIPLPPSAARPHGSDPPPLQIARGSSPAPLHEAGAPSPVVTPASSGPLVAAPPATPVVPKESDIATEPMSVQGSWQARVQQIRERAHEASKKAWRRAQTTAAQGLAVVRSEATQWRTDPRTAAQRWKPTRRAIVTFSGGILFGLIVALLVRSSPPAPRPVASSSSSPNRIAALFQRPPVTEQCKDAKPETELAALESPPTASVATPTKKALAKPKPAAAASTTKHPAIATTKPATTAPTSAPVAKPATTTTKTGAIAKTTLPTTTKPTAATKTTQPTTTAKTQPTTAAKTTQPTAKTTQPTAKTTQPTAKTTQPTTAAKTTQPTAIAKTTQPTTGAKTAQATTAKPAAATKPPVQAKASPATKTPSPKKSTKTCGLDCI